MELFSRLRSLRVTLIPVILILVSPLLVLTPLIQQSQLLRALNATVNAVRVLAQLSAQANSSSNETHGHSVS